MFSIGVGDCFFGFVDDLEVGLDGKVYFFDVFDGWVIEDYKFDILEYQF